MEDELIVAYDIRKLLEEIGYECLEPCTDHAEAVTALTEHRPDIALLDINLGGKKDGVDIARHIRANMDIPVIFLTANSDPATVERAKEVLPDAYLVKPFQKAHLFTAIEVALFAHERRRTEELRRAPAKLAQNALFVKDGQYFHKIGYDDVLFLSSNQNYVTVHTAARKYLVRATMHDYMEHVDPLRIVRVHRSYAVNIDKVDKINSATIFVAGNEIPMSKNYGDDLLRMLNLS